MSEEYPFGLELVLSAHGPHIKVKADALIVLIHWKLLTDGHLRCVGTASSSEILRPEAFFSSVSGSEGGGVSIKYRGLGQQKTSKYLLKLHEVDAESLLLNVIRISDEKVLTLNFNPKKAVGESFLSNTVDIANVYVDPKELIRRVDKEILDVLFPKPTESASLKVDRGTTSNYEPRPIHPLPGHIPRPNMPMHPFPDIVDPIGRGDLEPFSNDGSGMLMDPFGGRRRRDPTYPNFDPPMEEASSE
ncbi:Proteasome inhibitor PI31 subunitlike [Caligus rogercresseyi]|uniref:Proteasome inhibitor PI31 subunit n=1 Tax=Caligus rogercresseyi TaxID=217165 RepID=A0A7T8KHT9_CALRO|nr:Proteasome inhibitor PI31 subunitlike [Caligus rogercresseyi]